MIQPAADEVEVTVIGPNYGESILVHIGDQRWIIVDSTTRPGNAEAASLEYLRSLGLNPENCVELVVITHWHDDHVRGIVQTIDICKNAAVAIPSTFTTEEFRKFLAAHTDTLPSKFGTGVDEILGIFSRMRTRKVNHLAIADKRLLNVVSTSTSHGKCAEVWALSPSSFQVTESMGKMAVLIPGLGQTKRRAVPSGKNDHSVALWVSVGDDCILLGADLEDTIDHRAGWSAVVASTNRPQGQASIFKVPHHGSQNGHNASVWQQMLCANPHAILTPWNRASKLPTQNDLQRINSLTSNVHLTAPPADLTRVKHGHEIERLLSDFGIRTFREPSEIGIVTARKKVGALQWEITRAAA